MNFDTYFLINFLVSQYFLKCLPEKHLCGYEVYVNLSPDLSNPGTKRRPRTKESKPTAILPTLGTLPTILICNATVTALTNVPLKGSWT